MTFPHRLRLRSSHSLVPIITKLIDCFSRARYFVLIIPRDQKAHRYFKLGWRKSRVIKRVQWNTLFALVQLLSNLQVTRGSVHSTILVVPLVQVNTCFSLVQILSILHSAEKSICTSANTKPATPICIEGAV